MPGTAELRWSLREMTSRLSQSSPDSDKVLDLIRRDPTATMTLQGLRPDPYQRRILSNRSGRNRRLILNCGRQVGKSTVGSCLTVAVALGEPGSLVLLLSPSQRQSGELFRKCLEAYAILGYPVPALSETRTWLDLANGSRIVSLPGSEATVRGYSSAALLVIDEASRCSDELYNSCRPFLAVSGGTLCLLSTPWVKAGFFHEAWVGGDPSWERIAVPSSECPRISRQFLQSERIALGQRVYQREYQCQFSDVSDSCFFDPRDIARVFDNPVKMAPLFEET
jgi:hypothetical protein